MKNIFLMLLGVGLFLQCSSQNYLKPEQTAKLTDAMEFTFNAQKANIMGGDINAITNAIPNYTPSRMTNLDYGYDIIFQKDKITVTLPYFGRLHSGSAYDSNKQSLRFTSEDFIVQKSTTRKGNTLLKVKSNDVQHISMINIEIYKNGKAYVAVDASDRQPISYDGFISASEEIKK